ncbi:thiolase family protein [Lactobacillus sp. PV037]|uniref:thiolase family protein n=1 Tax=Lactobacillus sp. PV037 TaxID=2594496 RepID=UPI00223FDA03|nr:thiolase family protein [Lactobacillus sp. PV037]QNQ83281.1 thiolase family protein [Lactobacillus sp. PV037]
MRDMYIIAGKRTPFGKYRGFFKDTTPVELGSIVLKELLKETKLAPEQIEGVLVGNVLSAGLGQNVARQIALKSGLPYDVVATVVDDVCGSSLKALRFAQGQMALGDLELAAVGGVENMTNAPLLLSKADKHSENPKFRDSLQIDGIGDAYSQKPMGLTAEKVAERYHVSRKEMDEFAYNSHLKATKATNENWFKDEIVPVTINGETLTQDESIRPDTSVAALSNLKPVFKEDGDVTAGNSSPLNDGASMLLVASAEKVKELNLKPIGKIGDFSEIGCDPDYMGYGPYDAIKKLLAKNHTTIDDYDLIEINEAFAVQAYAVARDLKIPAEKLNIAGGAISLGHPLGATGTRLVLTALNNLKKIGGKRAIVSLCIGGGQAIAYEVWNQ